MEDNFDPTESCPTQMNIVSSSLDEQEPGLPGGSVGHDFDTSNSLTKTASSFNDLEKEPLQSPCEGKCLVAELDKVLVGDKYERISA